MAVVERDVVLQGKDKDGNQTIDLPITRLGNIEDSADVKEQPVAEDYIPVMDSADGGQMKKAPVSFILTPAEEAGIAAAAAQQAAAEAVETANTAQQTAEAAVTQQQLAAAIQAAVLDSWEGEY